VLPVPAGESIPPLEPEGKRRILEAKLVGPIGKLTSRC
jgi:hypothetical protein